MHSPKVQECFAKNFICTLSCVFSRLFPVYLLYNQQKGIQALWEPVLNSSIISSNRLYYYKDITKNDFLGDNFVSWKCTPSFGNNKTTPLPNTTNHKSSVLVSSSVLTHFGRLVMFSVLFWAEFVDTEIKFSFSFFANKTQFMSKGRSKVYFL